MPTAKLVDLPVPERLELMEALWISLCSETVTEPTSPSWHGEVLKERLARIASGVEQISSWQDAKQRICDQISSST